MQTKLQELTDKLYNEGLSKGKEEGEAILAKAKEEAEKIVKKATEEAAAIKAKAEKEAEDYKTKVENDVKMAAEQCLQDTKKSVETVALNAIAGKSTKEALSSAEFVKTIIKTVAEKFSAEQAQDLELILPASLQAELEPFVNGELQKALKSGVSASFSKKVAGGFTIGPKDGGYFISLTDETFNALICEYLRPATKKILFG
ncbi:MAG: hypothetical protein MJY83_00340 [Bacteroidales bacterium]|nr:hypothetical protein [Bacteroidales bacterium]